MSVEQAAADHLWLHFAPLGNEPRVMVKGEGSYLWDSQGRRYIDGMAGLFVVQAGHGRAEIAAVASPQAEKLGYYPIWGFAHESAALLAERMNDLTPEGMSRVFFTSGGSEAVESAWKLARQYHLVRGDTERFKVISRETTYHGTTLGALAITGIDQFKDPFRPMLPQATIQVALTNANDCPGCGGGACELKCADLFEEAIVAAGPETVAAIYAEPVQNSGGCFTPAPGYWQRLREICDQYGVLLVSDDVICGFGRLGEWFGAQKFSYKPDMITFAKGVTSGYAPLGGVIVGDHISEALMDADEMFMHGITFGGHPVSCAVALANLDYMDRHDVMGNVRRLEPSFEAMLKGLGSGPLAGPVRGTGLFYAVELQKDDGSKFTVAESQHLVVDLLKPKLADLGLLIRADKRGQPILQYSPCLTVTEEELAEIVEGSRLALEYAHSQL